MILVTEYSFIVNKKFINLIRVYDIIIKKYWRFFYETY